MFVLPNRVNDLGWVSHVAGVNNSTSSVFQLLQVQLFALSFGVLGVGHWFDLIALHQS